MTALAFLHGFGGSARSWDFVRAALGEHRCFVPTLRGFAGQDDVAPGWTLAHATNDALTRLAAVGLAGDAPFVLIGHSMGGKLAMAIAMRRPRGLRALVLLSPSPPDVEPISPEDRTQALRSHGSRAFAERNADHQACHWRAARRRQYVDDALATGPRAWAWWYDEGSREPLALTAGDLPAQVVVAVGDHDTTIPLGEQQRFVDRFPSTALTIIEGAAHQLPLDADVQCAEVICNALGGVSDADRGAGRRPYDGPDQPGR